ncbi:hypothetical protein XENORESO_014315, partial [Xenotaenia resolanae]
NSDGGYMDMNKDDSGCYVALKELGDAEPAVHETVHALTDHQAATSLLFSDSPLLTLKDLVSFSFQIAQAMDFLSSRKVPPLLIIKFLQILFYTLTGHFIR